MSAAAECRGSRGRGTGWLAQAGPASGKMRHGRGVYVREKNRRGCGLNRAGGVVVPRRGVRENLLNNSIKLKTFVWS